MKRILVHACLSLGLLMTCPPMLSAAERGDTLLYLSFDETIESTNGTVTVRSGTPAYSADTPLASGSSLHVTGSMLQLNIPKEGMLKPNLPNATIEFFIKGAAVGHGSWAVPLRITPNPNSVGAPPFPLLVQTDAEDRYSLRADCFENIDDAWQSQTDGRQTVSYASDLPFADGQWHHMALAIRANPNGSSNVKFYIDYVKVGEKDSDSLPWSGLTEAMTLDFGGASGLDGYVDELRISYGALEPCEFEKVSEAHDGDVLYHLSFDDESVLSSVRMTERGKRMSGTPVYTADEIPGPTIYVGEGDGREARVNARALVCDGTTVGLRLPLAQLQRPSLTSATIEFFMKGQTANAWRNPLVILNQNSQNTPPFPLLAEVNAGGTLNLRLDCGDDAFSYVDGSSVNQLSVSTPFVFTDGQWHHYAVTIESLDGDRTQVSYYLDHALYAVKASTDYAWKGVGDFHQLLLGTSNVKCWIDEFRISKGVLAPANFLSTSSVSPQFPKVLVHLPFDGDMTSLGHAFCTPKLTSGTPQYSAQGRYPRVQSTFGGDGTARDNNGALHVTGNLVFSLPGVMMQRPRLTEATIEFFIKGDATATAAWNNPIKIVHDPAKSWTTPPFPLLLETNNGGSIVVRLDTFDDPVLAGTDATARETKSSSVIDRFNDEKWHHVAVTIASAADGMTTYTWYLDYEQKATATTSKFAWSGLTPTSAMIFGGTGTFSYWLDELRISSEALDPSQFIRKEPSGLMLIFR